MANVKITDYTEIGADLVDADLIEVVDDVAGTPTSRKCLLSRIWTYILGKLQQVNAQTGTTYTLVDADHEKTVTLSNASAITLTVPNTLPVGFRCRIVQIGAGQVTVAGSSLTIRNYDSHTKLAGQYAAAEIIKYVDANAVFQGRTAA
jgi:hypothetical protein